MGLPRKLRGVGLHCFDFWSHIPSPIDCFLFAFPLDASLMLLLLDCISIECQCLEAAVENSPAVDRSQGPVLPFLAPKPVHTGRDHTHVYVDVHLAARFPPGCKFEASPVAFLSHRYVCAWFPFWCLGPGFNFTPCGTTSPYWRRVPVHIGRNHTHVR